MERYDYFAAVKEDVLNYINDNEIVVTTENRDEVEQELNDTLFTCDSVTGNASGSYTFNAWTAEERTLIENRIKDGYYTSEAIQERKDQKKREEYEKKRNEIIADCEKSIQEAENKKLVMLAVLDAGAIYYNHSNELAFNWNDYEEKVTQEQFDKFVNTVDKTKLPENITFKLKKL